MADKLKHLRSNTPAARPTGMTANDAGRIWINMADRVGGFINDLGQAVAFTLGSGTANPPEVINLPGGTSGSKAGIGAAYDAFTPKPVGDVVFAQYGDEIYVRTGAGTADADWGFVGEPVVYSTVAEVLAASEARQAVSPKALGDATRVNPSGVPADDAGRFIKLNASGQIDPGFVATAITDHKAEADPHTQYLTATEGNAAYEPLGTATVAASQAVLAHVQQADPHTQYLTATEGDALITAHKAEADPHPVYLTQAEGDSRYVSAGSLALPITVANGGTGATTAAAARLKLGAGTAKNYVINGGMRVAQRGDVTVTNNFTKYGGPDRWLFTLWNWTTGQGTLAQRDEPLAKTGKKLQVWGITTTGTGNLAVATRLEAKDTRLLAGKKYTLSCVVTHDFGVNASIKIEANYPNVADTFNSANTIGSNTVSVPSGTPTELSVTMDGTIANSSTGLQFAISLLNIGALTNRVLEVWDAELVEGESRVGVDGPSYAEELARCQRYYQKGSTHFRGVAAQGVGCGGIVTFPVTMRAKPVVVTADAGGSTGFPTTASSHDETDTYFWFSRTASVGSQAGIYFDTWTAEAEL